MYNYLSNPSITRCTFDQNTAESGGALFNELFSNPIVLNCRFLANTAVAGGGVLNSKLSQPVLINCTLVGNESRGGQIQVGGGLHSHDSWPSVINCIFWDNTPDEIVDTGTALTTVLFSNVEGGSPGLGNIDADPMFVKPGNGDFRLSPGSACIDAANNWAVAGLAQIDLDGNPRFAGDANDLDPGCGVPVVVDMGAYELPGVSFNVVFGDLSGNGTVGVADLRILNKCMGSDKPDCCIGDLNLDGVVDMADLMLLRGSMIKFVPVGALQ